MGCSASFFDVEGFAAQAVEVLRDPAAFRHLGTRAAEDIRRNYAIDVTLPHLTRLFEQAATAP